MALIFHRLLWRLGWADNPARRGEKVAIYPALVICEECDLVHERQALQIGDVARCARCGAVLGRGQRIGPQSQLALSLTALIVFVMGNLCNIVTLDLGGMHVESTLPEAIAQTWATGQQAVAVLAGATAFAFPLAVILLRLWVLVPLALGRRSAAFLPAMRALHAVTRWSMVEVFLLGTLVAIVRSAGLASLVPGVGIFSYAVLTVLLTAIHAAGLHGLWQHADECAA
jgi:paraquat-inducible protein A